MLKEIVTALLAMGTLAAVCLRVRVNSRFYRGLCRTVCAVWALALFSLIPGVRVGVNALSVACVSLLGLPGLGLLQAVAMMR